LIFLVGPVFVSIEIVMLITTLLRIVYLEMKIKCVMLMDIDSEGLTIVELDAVLVIFIILYLMYTDTSYVCT